MTPTDAREHLPELGLTRKEAEARLAEHGPNALPPWRPPGIVKVFLRQFRSPLIYILLGALLFELVAWAYEGATGSPLEAIAISVTLLLNALLGTIQERRSEAALARLKALAAPAAWVVRDGIPRRLSASELVPGDLIRLEAGDRVPADARLTSQTTLLVDESLLTGESLPEELTRGDDLRSGTLVARGQAHAVVTRTGAGSAMGRLAHLLAGLELGATPLERRVDRLGRRVAIAVLAVSMLMLLVGLLAEGTAHLPSLILLAVALGVAAVPEEMPAVLTLTLALGVERMARRKALVRRLGAVEALGSVTVIATDKTGTLTENRLRVHAVEPAPGQEDEALRAMVLANDADPASGAGDALDVAFLRHAGERGADPLAWRIAQPRLSERPFDSAWKYMRVTVASAAAPRCYLKGAPEAILPRCRLDAEETEHWRARVARHAGEGHKVLALAAGEGEREEGLVLLGLVALWDPPRAEVPQAVAAAQRAGIRVMMLTGDHAETARAIARQVGIREPRVMTGPEFGALAPEERRAAARTVDVFARVTPEHKLELVGALQEAGEIVAMTGDGVNDAPALKRADVGIAMGGRGSDVAREAASIVLIDDDFATIVHAIEEGRSLYENIQKFMRFMFSTSLAFVLLIVGGAMGSWALGLRHPTGELLLPLTAVQILWINFLADGPPAFALGLDRNPSLLGSPPRPADAPLLDRPSLRFILASACVKAGVGLVLLVLLPALGYGILATQAAVFGYEFLAQLVFAQPSRHLAVRPMPNRALRWALLGGLAVQVAIFLLPPVRGALGLAALDLPLIGVILLAVALTYAAAEGLVPWSRRRPAGRSVSSGRNQPA